MSILRLAGVCLLVATASGCSSWSTSNARGPSGAAVTPAVRPQTSPDKIVVTEADITDRPYQVIADLSVTVNKTTIFNKDPTKEDVAAKLREKAAEVGADAVILVRYGTVGISFMSWGSLDGKGRAVAFNPNH